MYTLQQLFAPVVVYIILIAHPISGLGGENSQALNEFGENLSAVSAEQKYKQNVCELIIS